MSLFCHPEEGKWVRNVRITCWESKRGGVAVSSRKCVMKSLYLVCFPKYHESGQIKESEIGRACNMQWRDKKYKIVCRKFEEAT
jgi:hypothetical protein